MTMMRVPRSNFRLRRIVVVLAVVMALAGAALTATTSPASALPLVPNCGARASSPVFAPWGDSNPYFPVANSGFESGSSEWKLTDAAAVEPGNESFNVADPTDAHSLAIPAGGQATSPTTCVAMGENTVRLFVKSSGTGPSSLHIQAFVQNALTGIVLSRGFDVSANDGTQEWSPTAAFGVPNLLGGAVGVQRLTLVFTTRGASTGSWSIDDVYVDPFKLR
ncbi:MAG: hypothetical protein QOE62_683 [Actinomycetota bacterium]|nr:hypothetical protein [Actinomycetota bacterium]